MRKKLVIDGNNLLHRAYWAYKKNEVEFKEASSYSVYVFLNILKSYVRLFDPSDIIVCWDYREEHETNKRKEMLEEYKGTRPDNVEVYSYMPFIIKILKSLGVRQMTPKSFEADDIMYWLCAKRYSKDLYAKRSYKFDEYLEKKHHDMIMMSITWVVTLLAFILYYLTFIIRKSIEKHFNIKD